MEPDQEHAWDVIVVGAGMAGLAAARRLAEAGRRVLVLEASERIGGRIRTERVGDIVIELGAEFIHGRPRELWDLVEEAGLESYERTGDFLHLEDGTMHSARQEQKDVLDGLKSFAGPDCSFIAYLEGLNLPEEERAAEIGYVEGFNAADASLASCLALGRQQVAEDAIEGDRVWRIRDGYDRLPAFLRAQAEAAGAEFRFNTRIEVIRWQPGAVQLQSDRGVAHAAAQAVIAVPLGILQAGELAVIPMPDPLPPAFAGLRMGEVCRFTMIFARRLWPETMSFLLTPELMPAVWWTAHPDPGDHPTLTGWTGGPAAYSLLALAPAELQAQAVRSLSAALQLPAAEIATSLLSFHTYNWQADPNARGAYSWVAVGGFGASAVLSQPVAATLFFAGEHTDTTGHWGTVHAALRSGLRAAQQVLGK